MPTQRLPNCCQSGYEESSQLLQVHELVQVQRHQTEDLKCFFWFFLYRGIVHQFQTSSNIRIGWLPLQNTSQCRGNLSFGFFVRFPDHVGEQFCLPVGEIAVEQSDRLSWLRGDKPDRQGLSVVAASLVSRIGTPIVRLI